MNNIIKNFLKVIIGLGILIFLVYKIGATNIWSNLNNFNWKFLPFLIIILSVSILIGSLNIVIFIKALNEKYRLFKIIKYYMISWAYGLILLGRLGEFSIIYFLKKEGISMEKGTLIALLDKAITFVVFFIVALFGFFTFFSFKEAIIIITIILTAFIIFLIIIITKKGRGIIKKLLRKYAVHFKGFSKNMFFLLKKRKLEIIINIILTFIKLLITALFVWVLFISFGVKIDYIPVLITTSTITILSLIPISIGGLGIRETSAVLLFSVYGVEASLSATVLLFYAVLRYILVFILITYGFITK